MKSIVSTVSMRGMGLALLLAVAGCSGLDKNMSKPGPQSVVGMSPVGTVTMSEVVMVGVAGGTGTLSFRGKSYPFKLAGGVTGGFGASDTKVRGEVYNLKNVSDFAGLYTLSTGGAGLELSGKSDLWLRNSTGVVVHMTGTQQGDVLSLGREEVLFEML